jgi:hypothetical protein
MISPGELRILFPRSLFSFVPPNHCVFMPSNRYTLSRELIQVGNWALDVIALREMLSLILINKIVYRALTISTRSPVVSYLSAHHSLTAIPFALLPHL